MYYVTIHAIYSRKLRKDIEQWCNENLIDMCGLSIYSRKRMMFYFVVETEAVAFKLRWL